MNTIIAEARRLWQLCFPSDTSTFLDFYFTKVAKAEDTYVDYDSEGHRAVAHIGILRYTYRAEVGASPLHLAYVSGACTDPNYRKQGLMSKLMNRVIQEERQRGTDALILIPADEELRKYYHQHFGFTDTAPRYTLQGADALKLAPYLYTSNATTSTTALITSYAEKRKAILYTDEQAQNIIDEYKLTAEVQENPAQPHSFLALSRKEDKTLYIDRLIGNEVDCRKYLEECLTLYEHIEVGNLFPTDLQGLRELKLSPQPWGMVLPISEQAESIDWHNLAISLVHN